MLRYGGQAYRVEDPLWKDSQAFRWRDRERPPVAVIYPDSGDIFTGHYIIRIGLLRSSWPITEGD